MSLLINICKGAASAFFGDDEESVDTDEMEEEARTRTHASTHASAHVHLHARSSAAPYSDPLYSRILHCTAPHSMLKTGEPTEEKGVAKKAPAERGFVNV